MILTYYIIIEKHFEKFELLKYHMQYLPVLCELKNTIFKC
jgi:hypothetical protein